MSHRVPDARLLELRPLDARVGPQHERQRQDVRPHAVRAVHPCVLRDAERAAVLVGFEPVVHPSSARRPAQIELGEQRPESGWRACRAGGVGPADLQAHDPAQGGEPDQIGPSGVQTTPAEQPPERHAVDRSAVDQDATQPRVRAQRDERCLVADRVARVGVPSLSRLPAVVVEQAAVVVEQAAVLVAQNPGSRWPVSQRPRQPPSIRRPPQPFTTWRRNGLRRIACG